VIDIIHYNLKAISASTKIASSPASTVAPSFIAKQPHSAASFPTSTLVSITEAFEIASPTASCSFLVISIPAAAYAYYQY
jgi:hypothetical protein